MAKSKKHSYFISTISIALVLFLLGTVAYISYMVKKGTDSVVDDIKITLLLDENSDKSQADELSKKIMSQNVASSVSYLSKEEAAEEYKRFTGEDFTLFIDENPLPASLEITLNSDTESAAKIDSITMALGKEKIVDEVLHPKGVVDQVLGHIYKIKFILYAFMITLTIISIVLINYAIKTNIRSKRFLIRSMKLIGATDQFICNPFLINGASQGFKASVFAWIMLATLFIGINRGIIGKYYVMEDLIPLAVICAGMTVVGIFLSLICTYIALVREINQDSTKLHIY